MKKKQTTAVKKPAVKKPAAKKPAVTGGNLAKALADLRTLAQEMRERSSFRVQFEDHHVMPASEIDDWQEIVREVSADASYTIPAELREVYALTGGFDFHWSCVADEGVFTGSIVLASLPELFQRDDEQKTPMKKCMAVWRRVDTVSDDSYAALRVDGGAAGVGCTFFKNGKPTKATWSLGLHHRCRRPHRRARLADRRYAQSGEDRPHVRSLLGAGCLGSFTPDRA